jgi:tRNA(Ile)-lysidine synthase
LLGLSGGGDSTALLYVLAPVARARGARLTALIVDHALRPDSAAEAARAAGFARDAGCEARIRRLAWDKTVPTQADARRARHAAFAEAARALGAPRLFLAHTRDDQAETILMRLRRGSGRRGLAGMAADAPSPLWPEGRDLRVMRPLLSHRRDELRAWLRDQGRDWIDDPSNTAERFERVRIRRELAEAPAAVERLAAFGDACAQDAAKRDRSAHAALRECLTLDEGQARLSVRFLEYSGIGAHRALAVLLAAVGAAPREPAPDAVARAFAALQSGEAFTLSGAHVARRKGEILAVRDPGDLLGRRGGGNPLPSLALPPGDAVVWDGRLALRAAEPGWRVTLGEGLRPLCTRGGAELALAEAVERGVVEAEWLLRRRMDSLLWRAAEQ